MLDLSSAALLEVLSRHWQISKSDIVNMLLCELEEARDHAGV